MRIKNNFNENWFFHMGELENPFKKNTAKTGSCGSVSNITIAEGAFFDIPESLKPLLGADFGNKLMNVAEKVEGEWSDVTLPHDWKIRQDYIVPKTASLGLSTTAEHSGGYLPDGIAYYRKKFSIPNEYLGKRIFVEFEGVMRDCIVWVNGSYIGSHYSGYTGFEYDVTEYLRYGDEGENVILVKTDTTTAEGWWGEGAGIYRNVWLNVLSETHIKRNGVFVYCSEIKKESAKVSIEIEIANKAYVNNSVEVHNTIFSQDGQKLLSTKDKIDILSLDEEKLSCDMVVENPILWQVLDAYQYSVSTEIICHGEVIDCVETKFGIRKIDYTSQGLLVNDKPVEIKGVCEHQDFAGVGIALTDDIIEYKIKRIKEMGANACRSVHHPATKKFIEICDREGILLMNENRRLEVNPDGLSDLEDLIKGSRNNPSVFIWCLENEECIALTSSGKKLLKTLVAYAKKLDPTRLVTVAGQFAKDDVEYMRIPDVAGFNYDAGNAQRILQAIPDKLILATEDVSFASTRGIYSDQPENGFCSSYDNGSYYKKLMAMSGMDVPVGTIGGAISSGDFVYAYYHYQDGNLGLGGMFVWTALDYRGETFPWNWPTINAHFGAMDMCGFVKDAFYYWQSLWTDTPIVHALPNWNFDKGEKVLVEVYSNCEQVELFINEKSQGKKEHTKGLISRWEVEYLQGELKVVGFNNGKEVASSKSITAGKPNSVKLSLAYNGEKEAIIKAEIVDQQGNLCPYADNLINFEFENCHCVGVGNGNPSSHESDIQSFRKAFNGLAMVIVKKIDEKIKVGAISEGLDSSEIII